MVFSSLLFLFIFLPLFFVSYFIVPKSLRNFILLIASLIFYAWGEPVYILIMIFSTVLDYSCGRVIHAFRDHKVLPKLALVTSITVNLGMLGFFKYADFFITNVNHFLETPLDLLKIALPIGISFYTFQTMSYTIDLYKGKINVQKNIISFGAYVTMFPQLIAGPIVTYDNIERTLDHRTVSFELFSEGTMRFIEGLAKKVLLANNIGMLWNLIQAKSISELSIVGAWLGIVAFSLQLYFDFSGYSDMAIGLGKIMGFHFPENFNYPYMAQSVTEFWRRWHITLGNWFREYVYIPLGGNRVPTWRHYLNIFIVWFLTGFWHGAGWNFIVWGVLFAFIMILEKSFLLSKLEKMPRFVRHAYLLIVVIISWVFFSHDHLNEGISYLQIMFGINASSFITSFDLYNLINYIVILCLGILFATPLIKKFKLYINEWVLYIIYIALLVLSTAYLVDATFNPFLYFRF